MFSGCPLLGIFSKTVTKPWQRANVELGAQACNANTQEAKAGWSLQVRGQLATSEFKYSLNYLLKRQKMDNLSAERYLGHPVPTPTRSHQLKGSLAASLSYLDHLSSQGSLIHPSPHLEYLSHQWQCQWAPPPSSVLQMGASTTSLFTQRTQWSRKSVVSPPYQAEDLSRWVRASASPLLTQKILVSQWGHGWVLLPYREIWRTDESAGRHPPPTENWQSL